MPEYTLIDCDSGLTYGPYQHLDVALVTADQLTHWEIIDEQDRIVESSRTWNRT